MCSQITLSCGRPSPYQYRKGALDDGVWWSDTDEHVADYSGGQAADEHRWDGRSYDGAADMGHQYGDQRTGMHISDSCG